MVGADKKYQLLQMSWRKVMHKYSRIFRRLPNTTVISLKKFGCKLDHLLFRTDFTQDLWVKYSIQCQIMMP